MKHRYQIKILNGPLAGRRLKLPEGDFVIGGDDPDLSATLEGGATATLTTAADGVRLRTAAPCWVDGKPEPLGEAPLPFGQVLDIGGLAVMVGEGDRPMPDATVPRRVRAEGTPRSASLRYGALVLLAAGSVGAGIWIYGAVQPPVEAVAAADWLDDWKRRARAEGVQVNAQRDGMLELSGSCRDSGSRRVLLESLREHAVPYRDNTQCQDELVRNVQAVLTMNGFAQAKVRSGDTIGTVAIQGTIHADARWRRAVAMLSELRGLQGWTVEDPIGASVRALIDRLRDAGLIGRLSVAREKGLILITGVLDEGGRRLLSSVTAAFAQANPEAPRTIFQNIPTRAFQAGIFPSPIVSFGGSGEMTFLDLANGTRLKAGSRLPGGHVIVHLDRNGIDLEREGELMHLPLEL
ncbi:type III secretion system inner membrane ring subunit SctD [Cupriavidus sp. AU9028]|uniref:type III secretion system inner membrane ring subunit SctD n=1 Tax=Cupriavidus sp. AU9028 TaxID=2871157 RepID=UPI001C94A518|nr:type III secretion system inner membrane ring subunit SctD [Cupriavidus sp. AU9028]MBY4897889.1 type III secretion system inner membrane ring subunit SctD [Cupriavidus sp. AU9028]